MGENVLNKETINHKIGKKHPNGDFLFIYEEIISLQDDFLEFFFLIFLCN